MRRRTPTLPLWLRIVVLAALLTAVAAAACADSIPAVQPPAVDPAPLEDAAERLQAAAERLEETVARASPESNAIIINKDALRLLALLSQLQIELGIIDALIDPLPYGALRRDSRPRQWPLEPEDGAALGFASARLSSLELQLFDFIRSLAEPLPTFDDDQILPMLVQLQSELAQIGHSIYVLWDAHTDGNATAPSIPRISGTRMQIARLTDSVGVFLATDHSGAALIPGAVWGTVNGLEHLGWAARGNCFAWNCYGGDYYGPPDFRERAFTVYSMAEFRSAPGGWGGYSSNALDNAYCHRFVADAQVAFWAVSSVWSQHARRFRDAGFDERADGFPPSLNSILSSSSVYRHALLACALSLAHNERRP